MARPALQPFNRILTMRNTVRAPDRARSRARGRVTIIRTDNEAWR